MDARIKRKEIMAIIALIILILLFVFIIVFVYANNGNYVIKEEVPVIDENVYVKIEDIKNDDYLQIYKSVNVKRVLFSNIPVEIVNDFNNKQDEIINVINNNIDVNNEYINNYNVTNNIVDYSVNGTLDSIVLSELKDGILSVLYLVEDNVDYKGLNNNILNIFIDVNNGVLVDNESLLEKYNLSIESVSAQVLENVINDHVNEFVNKDTSEVLTKEKILSEQVSYRNILMNNFDNFVYLYFNEDGLYLKYNTNDICSFLFNEDLPEIKYGTLKLEI